jgi:hypothetical protein
MHDQSLLPLRVPQARALETRMSRVRATRRKRIAQIHAGAIEVLDAAVEARRDTEETAREFQIRRPDVQDLFAWKTRRMLRQVQGELRAVRGELVGRERVA